MTHRSALLAKYHSGYAVFGSSPLGLHHAGVFYSTLRGWRPKAHRVPPASTLGCAGKGSPSSPSLHTLKPRH